jgi:hypothetical protein
VRQKEAPEKYYLVTVSVQLGGGYAANAHSMQLPWTGASSESERIHRLLATCHVRVPVLCSDSNKTLRLIVAAMAPTFAVIRVSHMSVSSSTALLA